MAQANIKAVITAEDRASKVLNNFGGSASKLGLIMGSVAGVTQALATKAIGALSNSISGAVSRVDTLSNSNRVFANMGFSATATQSAMDALNASILGLPTSLDQAVQGTQMLAGATGDVGQAQQVFSALNNAIIGFGGTSAQVTGVVQQLSQAISGGRIDAQTWNSMLQNGLGPTLNAIAKDMGLTTQQLKEGLSTGSISVEQFNQELIKLNTQGGGGLASLQQIAKDATAGIGTSFQNAATSVVRGLGNILNAIGQSNISGVITTIGEGLGKFLTAFGNAAAPGFKVFLDSLTKSLIIVSPYLQQLATILGETLSQVMTALAPSIRPLALAFSIIAITVAQLVQAFAPLIAQLINALAPIMPVIADAINQVANAFIQAIMPVMPQLIDAFKQLIDAAIKLVPPVTELLIELMPLLPLLIQLAIKALPYVIYHLNMMVDAVKLVVNIIRVVKHWINDFISVAHNLGYSTGLAIARVINWFNAFRNAARDTVNGIVDWFRQLPGRIAHAISNIGGAIRNIVGGVKIAGRSLSDLIPGFAGGVTNFAGGLAIVGERGPELVNLPRGSDVIPNNKIPTQASNNTTININVGMMTGSANEQREAAMRIFENLQDIANTKGRSVGQMIGA